MVFLSTLALLLILDGIGSYLLSGHLFLPLELELATARAMFDHNPEVLLRPLSWLTVHCSYQEGTVHHLFKLFFGVVDHYGGLKLFSSFAGLGFVALLYSVIRRRNVLLPLWLAGVFPTFSMGSELSSGTPPPEGCTII